MVSTGPPRGNPCSTAAMDLEAPFTFSMARRVKHVELATALLLLLFAARVDRSHTAIKLLVKKRNKRKVKEL